MLKSPTGKIYIGQTTLPIQKRFEKHRQKNSDCVAISNAIQYHGWGNFEKDWYECPDEDLNFDEELLVREMRTLSPEGYNLREGGGSNGKMSEESKKKMSEARTGISRSEETKKRISESTKGKKNHMYGKTHASETKKKMSDVQVGKTLSDDTKKKMSENNPSSRRVYQYDMEENSLGSFISPGEAARQLGKIDGSNIKACARGKRETAYGFKWSYNPPSELLNL